MPVSNLESLIEKLPEISDALTHFNDPRVKSVVAKELISVWRIEHELNSQTQSTPSNSKPAATESPSPAGEVPASQIDFYPSGRTSFKGFVEDKEPTSNPERCLVAVYWMTNIAGISNVSAEHVSAAFDLISSWQLPANMKKHISSNQEQTGLA